MFEDKLAMIDCLSQVCIFFFPLIKASHKTYCVMLCGISATVTQWLEHCTAEHEDPGRNAKTLMHRALGVKEPQVFQNNPPPPSPSGDEPSDEAST